MTAPFPPYDPGGSVENKKKRTRRFQKVPVRMILPNVVTLLALCAGLTAIRMAFEARWEFAMGAIILAAVLDGLDGRVARMVKGTSRFGAELDSLSDFVNFGVAPAIILYAWMLDEARSLGWIAAMIYAICCALRLARFNVALDEEKPKWAGKFFTGVPSPAGAIIVLLPLYIERLGMPHYEELATPVGLYALLIGFLMVSQLPSFSGKQFGTRVRREWVLPLFVVFVALVALLLSFPFETMTVVTLGYLASIPFAFRSFRKHMREDAEAAAAALQDTEDKA
ncbi:CDP-diacylglycerol--serine O-phosphatidyltransferase [Pseudovibrio sp. SPO723]|uniref:CDP-diacylglycerol--serine O-phosphatidyltransferase n=1 Tax=Nesiotobacter zosterae TaxID=392721 RepID=UPI0029C5B867|nr:CDP-diacylglycerol--serine O-phosphatidyltransferase [Pseudovibrio sp. SPO723]MDX5593723.1 CDP-diacylglycerol--serine O-phosphatidyltransferase [Pseudovibrio sp. SPO723]